jgi:hypothetical protein
MIKIFLLIVIYIISISVYAESKIKSIRGFQNIPWYSSVTQVKKAISDSIVVNHCDYVGDKKFETELRKMAHEDNMSCRSVINYSYYVTGIKFNLDATFNNKDQLSSINLKYFPDKDKDIQDSLKNCEDVYSKILSLLEIKYGDSLYVKNGIPASGYENFDMRVWVLSPTEIWIRKSWGYKNKETILSSSCRTEINYGPRVPEETDKL